MKTNDTNNFRKRTASTIKSILKANDISFDYVENQGDGNQFIIGVEPTILNLMKLKQVGFIRITTGISNVTIKTN